LILLAKLFNNFMFIYFFIFIPICILFFLLYKTHKINKANRGMTRLNQYRLDFEKATREFEIFVEGSEYFNNKKYTDWNKQFGYLLDKINFDFRKATIEQDLRGLVSKYSDYLNHAKEKIDKYNENFIEKESEKILPFLNNLGIESNNDQRRAIACGEDKNLIIAGAGTGKTQTILGKVAYLCRVRKIKPEGILLLSFTKKATQELKDRINKIDSKLHINTFNSLGYFVIGQVLGDKPKIAFENDITYQRFINDLFNLRLGLDNDFLNLAINYFLYYLYPIELISGHETKDEYYKSLRMGNTLTIKKEKVKSIQEAMIANFLYSCKINYEYEKQYKYKTSDREYSQYAPDFYLTDYDIYLEHFGIDRKGKTHFTNNEEQNKSDSIKYNADIKTKRDIHLQYKTSLIETYSYEFFEGNWQIKLLNKLQEFGIKIEKRSEEEILKEIKKGDYIRLITPLICTFLNLMKSCDYSIDDIKNKIEKNKDTRGAAFIQIFTPIYESYRDYLKENNKIDFNDMLLLAAEYIGENKYIHNYKYIIIDEFQDFSFSKYELIKRMLDQNANTKLLCVGDDWQSIFRFSGSDINLMINFENYFGFTKIMKLEKCHRFSDQLAEISNNFILRNKNQLSKKLFSDRQIEINPLQIIYKNDDQDIISIKNILGSINKFAQKNNIIINDVLLLGRFRHNKPKEINYNHYRNIKNIEFLTIHQAKGLTCDYAIILNNETGKYGFPSDFADDPLINYVLSEVDPTPNSEERRLMYVAMTRARNQVFLIADKRNRSLFIRELEKQDNNHRNEKICRECGGEMVLRVGPYGKFYGCSNFPRCQFSEKINFQEEHVDCYNCNDQDSVIELSFQGSHNKK